MSECTNKLCGGRGWYLKTEGISTTVVECLDCKYRKDIEKHPSLNSPFQEIYDKAKRIEEGKGVEKGTEKINKEEELLLIKIEKIKKLSKKDKEEWLEFNRLQNKFKYLECK